MIEELISLANNLDSKGLYKEADALDAIIKEAGIWDFLGFAQAPKEEVPEIMRSPLERALYNLDNELDLTERRIRRLRSNLAGDDITDYKENKRLLIRLEKQLADLEARREKLSKLS